VSESRSLDHKQPYVDRPEDPHAIVIYLEKTNSYRASTAPRGKIPTIRFTRGTRLPHLTATTPIPSSAPSARRVVLLVPTCNPGPQWQAFLQALKVQTLQPDRCIVVDSESTDGAPEAAQAAGLTVHRIARADFNHGTTRQLAIEQFAADADLVVFLTQDAVLAEPSALQQLVAAFDDATAAAAFGRQLPHDNATPMAAHARMFNYPATSHTRCFDDAPAFGIKTCFLSNSFAAYRVSALQEVGGFPTNVILGEDMHLAARLLKGGHTIAYQALATVYHSHNYALLAEFRRYFDTGVFHAQHHWLTQDFGGAGSEGIRFLRSEMAYLLKHAPWQLPEAVCRTALKALGYRLGLAHAALPQRMVIGLSMHKGYWA
jgi:rhamnosyltransferase